MTSKESRSMGDVWGVTRTTVVGSKEQAEEYAKKQGGVSVLLYDKGCTLSGQKVKVGYEEGNRAHYRTFIRAVRNVRAGGRGFLYGERSC